LVRRVIEDFIDEYPSISEMVETFGTSKATGTCKKRLEILRMRLGHRGLGGVDMREVVEGRDSLRGSSKRRAILRLTLWAGCERARPRVSWWRSLPVGSSQRWTNRFRPLRKCSATLPELHPAELQSVSENRQRGRANWSVRSRRSS
jgi:hypothetical protein